MARYIDADALKLPSELPVDPYDTPFFRGMYSGWNNALKECKNRIDSAPTISPDEVRGVGEWEESEYSGYLRCSACKDCHVAEEYFSEHYAKWRYCPSCGAKMSRAEAEKAMEVSGDA